MQHDLRKNLRKSRKNLHVRIHFPFISLFFTFKVKTKQVVPNAEMFFLIAQLE